MSMSTTRNLRNRSSRYSSPATFTESQSLTKPAETQSGNHGVQTSLDVWVEPPVRTPVASFEDTKGLERVGVLEHMAPLGVPPSQKLLQKLKINLSRYSPRVTPVHNEDATPPTESARVEAVSPVDTEPLLEPGREEEEQILISSPPRGRPAKKEIGGMQQVIDITTPSPVKSTFDSTQVSPRPQSIQDYIRQDRMKSVIERAITEAANHQDPRVIPGLQNLWEDAKTKPYLWGVLDAILNKTPKDADFRIFKRYIKRGIKDQQEGISELNTPQAFNHLTSPPLQPATYPQTSPTHRISNNLTTSNIRPGSNAMRNKPFAPLSPSSKMAPLPTANDLRGGPRRKRSGSESSTSSLSSAKSLPEDFSAETIEVDSEGQATDGQPVRTMGQRQATNRVAAGSRTRSSVVPQSEISQTAHGLAPSAKSIHKKSRSGNKKDDFWCDSEIVEARRHDFENGSFLNYNTIIRPESDFRTIVHGLPHPADDLSTRFPPPVVHPHTVVPPATSSLSSLDSQRKLELPTPNGAGRKRAYDEIDNDDFDIITPLSSSPAPFAVQPPSDIPASVRGSTPKPGRFPPPNKARKSARVMISPNKPKNGGITAGISRAGPARDSAIGNGADSSAEDNDEFCASCGGEGTLLCCDGCTHSFHHGCLEPPLNPDDEVDGEWFCPRCIARKHKEVSPATGLLGQVARRLDHTIPKAFALPFPIRDYFEGVKTGDEGEYEEVGLPRTQNTGAKMNRAGFFEEPSYKELRDNKGNFIVCYRCQKTSNGRDIIPCDYCPAKWHMDCLDPPLAVPPRRRGGDKPTGSWRCPLHVDGDLAEIGRQIEAAPGDLGRVPRLRKPKDAFPIDVDLSRGFQNNGVVEVELMKDEKPDIREVTLDHGIYRLPEKGIRLDFIDRVKKSWYEDQMLPLHFNKQPRIRARLYRPDGPVLHHPAAYTLVKHKDATSTKGAAALAIAQSAQVNAQLGRKSFPEQKAVISLLALSDQRPGSSSIDPLADLTNALIAEAPDDVAAAINTSEKTLLLELQKLIDRRLTIIKAQTKSKSKTDYSIESDLVNGDTTMDSEQLNGDAEGDANDEGSSGERSEIHAISSS